MMYKRGHRHRCKKHGGGCRDKDCKIKIISPTGSTGMVGATGPV